MAISEGRGMDYRECSRGRIARRDNQEVYTLDSAAQHSLRLYDWGRMHQLPSNALPVVLVQFKNKRYDYFVNAQRLPLQTDDLVTVAVPSGRDVGAVALTGWLAWREYVRTQADRPAPPMEVYRHANANDVEKWIECISQEASTMFLARGLAERMELPIKILAVEFQGDGKKATFYFNAESRVDFRGLVRSLAAELHVRIEMRQIGPRQGAVLLGGMGPCGQCLCCSRWKMEIRSVTTATIKAQELYGNIQKLAGQCGKLKCCLNFELEAYLDARRHMPTVKAPLQLEDMQLYYVKNDLFRQIMWFAPEPKSTSNLVMLSVAEVRRVIALNAEGKKGAPLEDLRLPEPEAAPEVSSFDNVIVEENITRFDRPKRQNQNRNRRRNQHKGRLQQQKAKPSSEQGKA